MPFYVVNKYFPLMLSKVNENYFFFVKNYILQLYIPFVAVFQISHFPAYKRLMVKVYFMLK